jgi:F-type H+-transporting ATPase subunit epsilon
MTGHMELEIITAIETAVRAQVTEVYVPACLGQAGILFNHRPYITVLQAGELYYRDIVGTRFELFVTGGFLEVRDNRVTVIADSVERPDSWIREDLETRLQTSEAQIQSASSGTISPDELIIELANQRDLLCRLDVLQKVTRPGH